MSQLQHGASNGAVRRLALANVLSGTGSQLAAVALSFHVYELTESAYWLAGTLILTFGVTAVLAPVAGLIADRYDRRRVMVSSDSLSALLWIGLLFVDAPAGLVALAFAASVIEMPFGIASAAAIPNMVDETRLSWANGLISAAGNTARLAGPLLGGVLYALGGADLAFGVNAASFVISALLVATVRARFRSAVPEDEEHGGGLLAGFGAIRADGLLLRLATASTIAYFAMNIAFVADVPLARSFGVGSVGYGLIDTFFGAGLLIGSLAARRIAPGTELRWVRNGALGVAAGWALISVTLGSRWYSSAACWPRCCQDWPRSPSIRSTSNVQPTRSAAGCLRRCMVRV